MRTRFALGLLILTLTRAAFATDAIDLKFHPAKGSVQKLQTILDQKITQTTADSQTTLTQTVKLLYRMNIEDIAPDGLVTMKVTYESVAFKQQSALGNVEYDSTNPPPGVPAAARGFAAI